MVWCRKVQVARASLILGGIALFPGLSWADLSLGTTSDKGGKSKSVLGRTGFSELSNREYQQRQESAALERARKLKEAMRKASDSLPGAEPKRGSSTGISDGTFYSERLKQIQRERAEEERRNRGVLERIGDSFDAMAEDTSYIERRRAGEVRDGFHPLDGLGRLADQVGETTQDLLVLPKLDRSGVPPVEAGVQPQQAVGRMPADPEPVLRPQDPESEAVEKPAGKVGAGLEGFAEKMRQVGRRTERPARVADREPLLRGERNRSDRMEPEVAAADPGSNVPLREGEEKFELDDVYPANSSSSGGLLKGLQGGRRSGGGLIGSSPGEQPLVSRLKTVGSREDRSGGGPVLPEPTGPLAEDPALYVIRSGKMADFYPFGDDSSSSVRLAAGAVVRVTKPGDEWTGVETSGGRSGILRTELIRRAHASEIGAGMTAPKVARKSREIPGSGFTLPEITFPSEPKEEKPVSRPAGPSREVNPERKTPLPLGLGLLPPVSPDGI